MEHVQVKLLESEISGAKKYEVSIGSYRRMSFESSNEVKAALNWIRTIQQKYAVHRREKGMVVGVSLDGPGEGPFTHLTMFVGKYGISISMEGGLPKAIEMFLKKPNGIFFSGYDMLEKKDRLEKQTGIAITNVLELKQGAVELHAPVTGLQGSSYGVVPEIPVDAGEEDRAKYYFLAAFQAFMIGKEKIKGSISEKRVTELTLQEFLCYGPQREVGNGGKSMFRKATDGRLFSWKVEDDDTLRTLKEGFQKVDSSLGFNIKLKFDDNVVYEEDDLIHVLQIILQVVFEHAKERPIYLFKLPTRCSTARSKITVSFLTDGGSELYTDVRRNSLDEAIKLSVACGLQGIVSEVRAIFRNPGAISKLKEANLCLLTYGQLNNIPEAVYMQRLMGINGVIVDLVKEITEAVSDFTKPAEEGEGSLHAREGEGQIAAITRPNFSQRELSFLLKLIPQLIHSLKAKHPQRIFIGEKERSLY